MSNRHQCVEFLNYSAQLYHKEVKLRVLDLHQQTEHMWQCWCFAHLSESHRFCRQILGKVYAVLSDKEQRAVYDEQGVVDDESDSLDQDRDWEEHWRRLFPKVS